MQASGSNCQMGMYLAAVFQDDGHKLSEIKIGLNKVVDKENGKEISYTTFECVISIKHE